MAETANLLLPFLAAGQAQKHLTVNEALERLDVLLMLSARSRGLLSPPTSPAEGDRYVVPAGADGSWSGRDGSVAAFLNGGWRFFTPRHGWRCFIEDEARDVVFASGVWTESGVPGAVSGAVTTLEFDHAITPGGAQSTAATLPSGCLVFGVTARVVEPLVGPPGWSLGVSDAPTRYGAALPVAAGAGVSGATGAPLAYLDATPLLITPEADSFMSGRLRIAIHFMMLTAPAA
jgi:hypothetical protein